jgi:PIN domain nuclease of toxin-antitoxin system
MRYLIDTNIFLFYAKGAHDLTGEVKDILMDYGSVVNIPSRCVEEMIHMRHGDKYVVRQWKSAEDIINAITKEFNFGINHTGNDHLRTLARLPTFPDHKDPVDRMAIAHAITENTTLISSDEKFFKYTKYGLNFLFNER